MLKDLYKNESIKGIAATLLIALMTGCNSEVKLFDSGLANEWSGKDSIATESLVIQPSYYFRGLDEDLGYMARFSMPQGKLFRDISHAYKIDEVQGLLGDYISLLESLPNGNTLPEYRLANIYFGLASDYIDYLDDRKSMFEIANTLGDLHKEITHLESQLDEADIRGLSLLIQTFPRHTLSGIGRQ